MRTSRRWAASAAAIALAGASGCRAGTPSSAPESLAPVATVARPNAEADTDASGPSATDLAPPALEDYGVVTFPDARSVAVAQAASEGVVVAFGRDEGLFVARSEDGGRTFDDAVRATGDRPVHVMPIERPAVAVDDAGRLGVAWLELPPDGEGGDVWYAGSEDGGRSFAPGGVVATDDSGETTMVSVALVPDGGPVLAWLNGSALRFERSVGRGGSFHAAQRIGDGACECCQPDVATGGGRILIAYRGLDRTPDGFVRDLAAIRSADGGATFEPVTAVSDAHWYLEACPIAGPSMAVRDDDVVIAWMDGRAEPKGTLSRGDVWLASSKDGGATFGPNVRVNADRAMHHTLPTVAFGPDGRIHVAWQADGAGPRLLYHAVSDDGGRTFGPPRVIAGGPDAGRGAPNMADLTVSPRGRVALAWVDRIGAHVATWTDERVARR